MATTQCPAPPNSTEVKPQTTPGPEVVQQQANDVQQEVSPPEDPKKNVSAPPPFGWQNAVVFVVAVVLLAVIASIAFSMLRGALSIIVTASGAGIALLSQIGVLDGLKYWIRRAWSNAENGPPQKIDAKPSSPEKPAAAAAEEPAAAAAAKAAADAAKEAAAAAKDAAAAAKEAAAASKEAAHVARASQEMLNSKNEERRRFEELMKLIDVQVQEMKSLSNAIKKLEATF